MTDAGAAPDVDKGNGPSRGPRRAARSSGSGGERVTVNLTEKAAQAMGEIVEITGDNKTDSINRALIIYAEFVRVIQDGGAVYLREAGAREPERVRFL